MAEGWRYHVDIQQAIDNNGGMHFAYFVGGIPCGTVCEQAELSNVKSGESFAYTDISEQVTCPMCKGVMNA